MSAARNTAVVASALMRIRFWHKGFVRSRPRRDAGTVLLSSSIKGLILGSDGQKMSKSRGNVVNPDDILVEYGADAFRLYEMFHGYRCKIPSHGTPRR